MSQGCLEGIPTCVERTADVLGPCPEAPYAFWDDDLDLSDYVYRPDMIETLEAGIRRIWATIYWHYTCLGVKLPRASEVNIRHDTNAGLLSRVADDTLGLYLNSHPDHKPWHKRAWFVIGVIGFKRNLAAAIAACQQIVLAVHTRVGTEADDPENNNLLRGTHPWVRGIYPHRPVFGMSVCGNALRRVIAFAEDEIYIDCQPTAAILSSVPGTTAPASGIDGTFNPDIFDTAHWAKLGLLRTQLICDQTFWLMEQHFRAMLGWRGNDRLLYSTLDLQPSPQNHLHGRTKVDHKSIEPINDYKDKSMRTCQSLKNKRPDGADGEDSDQPAKRTRTAKQIRPSSSDGDMTQLTNAGNSTTTQSATLGGGTIQPDGEKMPDLVYETQSSSSWDTISLRDTTASLAPNDEDLDRHRICDDSEGLDKSNIYDESDDSAEIEDEQRDIKTFTGEESEEEEAMELTLTPKEMEIMRHLRPMVSMPLQRQRQLFSMIKDEGLALRLAAAYIQPSAK